MGPLSQRDLSRAGWGSPRVDLADRNVEPGSDVLYSLIALGDDAHALGNGLGRDGVIAGDHDDLWALCANGPASLLAPGALALPPLMPLGPHLDACTAALAHRVGDSRSGRVDHGHETHEAEVVSGEVHIVTVEGKALGELLLGQVVVAETWCGEKGRGAVASVPPDSCPQLPWQQSNSPAGQSQSTLISERWLPLSFIQSRCILRDPILSQALGSTTSLFTLQPLPQLGPTPGAHQAHARPGHRARGRHSGRPPSSLHPAAAPCRAAGWWSSGPGCARGRPSSPAGTGCHWGPRSRGWRAANRAEGGHA